MSAAAVRYENVQQEVAAQMTRAQRYRLRSLSEEAYQPKMFDRALSQAEAERRISALRAEIELAESF